MTGGHTAPLCGAGGGRLATVAAAHTLIVLLVVVVAIARILLVLKLHVVLDHRVLAQNADNLERLPAEPQRLVHARIVKAHDRIDGALAGRAETPQHGGGRWRLGHAVAVAEAADGASARACGVGGK